MVPWGLWNPLLEQPAVPCGVPAAFQRRSGVAGTVPALPAGTPQNAGLFQQALQLRSGPVLDILWTSQIDG